MTDKAQLFLNFAEQAMVTPVKRRLKTKEKRYLHKAQEKAMQEALAERDLLMRLWKKWRKEILDKTLIGPYETAILELIKFLEKLNLTQEKQLIPFIQHGPWLKAPRDIKFLVLQLIDTRLVKLREKQGLPPWDDPLFGQNTFLIIRTQFLKAQENVA